MAEMNPRHIATFVLVGWYLMIPPLHDGKPDTQAPIKAWTVFRRFDSETACQKWKLNTETRARRSGRYGARPDFICIATDDPRLKEK
jgi:hypothetical protein